jgi:hypothetical protein
MSNIIAWVTSHPVEVAEGYLALVGLASWLIKIVPTLKKREGIILNILKFIGKWVAVDKYGPSNT